MKPPAPASRPSQRMCDHFLAPRCDEKFKLKIMIIIVGHLARAKTRGNRAGEKMLNEALFGTTNCIMDSVTLELPAYGTGANIQTQDGDSGGDAAKIAIIKLHIFCRILPN